MPFNEHSMRFASASNSSAVLRSMATPGFGSRPLSDTQRDTRTCFFLRGTLNVTTGSAAAFLREKWAARPPLILPLTAIARYRGEPPLDFGPWSAGDLGTRRTTCFECLSGLECMRIVGPSWTLGPIVARDSCGSRPTGGANTDLSGPGAACSVLAA